MTLRELAEVAGGRVAGDDSVEILGITSLDLSGENDLVFATDPRWLTKADSSSCAAILAPEGSESAKPLLLVTDVREALQALLPLFEQPFVPAEGIHPTAVVEKTATIGEGARIGPFVYVGEEAVVAQGVMLHAFAYVGDHSKIGEGSVLHPRATLMPHTTVGKNCQLFAGCVIGGPGFGYRLENGKHVPVKQIGCVVLGDEVDVGANVTIDRAMVGATVIGSGTKIDNLVQIGHNVQIGSGCIIVSQTGISGSARLEAGVVLGGQTGVAEHVVIGPGVRTGGQTGVTKSLSKPGDYWGTPARPFNDTLELMAAAGRLPKLIREVRELRERLAKLEAEVGG